MIGKQIIRHNEFAIVTHNISDDIDTLFVENKSGKLIKVSDYRDYRVNNSFVIEVTYFNTGPDITGLYIAGNSNNLITRSVNKIIGTSDILASDSDTFSWLHGPVFIIEYTNGIVELINYKGKTYRIDDIIGKDDVFIGYDLENEKSHTLYKDKVVNGKHCGVPLIKFDSDFKNIWVLNRHPNT